MTPQPPEDPFCISLTSEKQRALCRAPGCQSLLFRGSARSPFRRRSRRLLLGSSSPGVDGGCLSAFCVQFRMVSLRGEHDQELPEPQSRQGKPGWPPPSHLHRPCRWSPASFVLRLWWKAGLSEPRLQGHGAVAPLLPTKSLDSFFIS